MAWHTENMIKDGALTTASSVISKNIINRSPTHMIIEVFTDATETGDVYLQDSGDGTNWTQVATTAYDAATSLVWRVDARTTPLRTQCRVLMKLDSGTGNVSKLMVTWES